MIRRLRTNLAALMAPRARPTRADLLRAKLDRDLAARRIGRADRQAAAVERESAKHHARFVRDPIIRELRPDAIAGADRS